MSSIPTESKASIVLMTFTVAKTLPANPKFSELEAVKQAATDAMAALAKVGGEVSGELTIGKQKFKL